MAEPIRVLIADDHTIVRSGVRLLIESEPDMVVVGEAVEGEEAYQKAKMLQPDVILMDIAMPGMDGIAATHRIKAEWPHIQILVLTMHRSNEYFFEVLRAGASGYILKGAETDQLIHALRTVVDDEVFLHPTVARQLVKDYLIRSDPGRGAQDRLSPREQEVLQLLADGFTSREIAERLVVSQSTVYTHRNNLMRKLNLNSRHELIKYARRQGFIQDL